MNPSLICLLAWAAFSAPVGAEVEMSVYGGSSLVFPQDIKAREFDLPGRQVRFEERHVLSFPGASAGAGLRYFFHENFGVQGDLSYGETPVSVDMQTTSLGQFTMVQRRYGLLLSLVARRRVHALGLSAVYGSFGMGYTYADFTYIPEEWVTGGQMSIGADLASNRRSNFFVELKYLWHHDVGNDNQDPGIRLKTSGEPRWNLANKIFGSHDDTQTIRLLVGLRFRLSNGPAP